jgi:hypothetical protein
LALARLMRLLLPLLLLMQYCSPKIEALQVCAKLQGVSYARQLLQSRRWLPPAAAAVRVLQIVHFCSTMG